MQIVINIDEETYNDIKKGKIYSSFRDVPLESVNAIANGTPLPKGHGRLIDADEVNDAIYKCFDGIQFYDGTGYDIYSDSKESLDKIQPIIEADNVERDK